MVINLAFGGGLPATSNAYIREVVTPVKRGQLLVTDCVHGRGSHLPSVVSAGVRGHLFPAEPGGV